MWDKKTIANFLYYILIVIVILTCIFIVFLLNTNAYACLKDPLAFYGEKVGGAKCFCFKSPF